MIFNAPSACGGVRGGSYTATIMELGKTSHTVYKIRYHMAAVKYRKVLLNSAVEDCIKETLKGISERYEIVIDEVGFDQNHIYLFCGAPPRMSLLRVISIIKSVTARQIFKQFPKLKIEELWGGEFWIDSKYIDTVGEATSEKTIRIYIRNQNLDKEEIKNRMK
jgi:putative transposase